MDDDTADLVRQLCTRAGMIMEDASPLALLVGEQTHDELLSIVGELKISLSRARSILAVAKALIS